MQFVLSVTQTKILCRLYMHFLVFSNPCVPATLSPNITENEQNIFCKFHKKDTVTLACLSLWWSRQVYDDQLCILRPFTNHFVQSYRSMHPLHIAIRSTIVIIYFKSCRT